MISWSKSLSLGAGTRLEERDLTLGMAPTDVPHHHGEQNSRLVTYVLGAANKGWHVGCEMQQKRFEINAVQALRRSVWILLANALFQQKCCRQCYIHSKAMAGGENSTLGVAAEAIGCFRK